MKNQLITGCLFLITFAASAQVDKNAALYQTILARDSLLFEVGFNTCNIPQFEALLSDKLDFFHDQGGISDRKKFLQDLKTGLCKDPANLQVRRELLPGCTEIYALYNQGVLYGAIQEGVHQFFEKQPGQPETFGSSARFTHVWLLENGDWKLTQVLSFEHREKQLTATTAVPLGDDAAMAQWLKENKVPTLGLGIIENGKLKQVKVFGEITKGVSAPYNTLFNVASLTKPVTALVALKLVSTGRWDLDEPLYRYWTDPDLASDPNHQKLTTRHILSHQTGFLNWRWMTEDQKLRFQFEPGTRYQYSGEGFEYLRKALEQKFKKSLPQLAEELIFQPLKMSDTRFVWDETVDTTRLAPGYDPAGKAYATVKRKTPNAADDLLTTVEDYGNFLASVLNRDGLSARVFDDMVSHQVETKKDKYFGLGFEVYDLGNGRYALSHGGSDKGCQTIAFIFPETGQGLLIFTNVDDGYKVYEPLLKHYLGANGSKIIDIEMK